jgi:hypothetical protein
VLTFSGPSHRVRHAEFSEVREGVFEAALRLFASPRLPRLPQVYYAEEVQVQELKRPLDII